MLSADTHASVTDLVSVIVPVYNAEKYLHRCIASIINQSYNNIEIILINDGSTDNSGEICNSYSLRDNRIRVIHTQNNGPAAARNTGMEISKGEFIFFLDADDLIKNSAIESLIESYNQTKADMIVGDFKKVTEDGSISGHNGVFTSSNLLTKQDIIDYVRCYLKNPNRFELFAYCWGRLFKSSTIKNNDIVFHTELRTYEDVAFNFDYLNYTNEMYFLKEPIYNHLVHDNYASLSMTIGRNPINLFGFKQAFASISTFLNNSGADIKKEVGHAYISHTMIQLVRTCGQVNNSNKKKVYEFIHKIINNSDLRDNLQFYFPSKGDSRVIPILMKLKLVLPIILVCKYKAYRRYGKKRGNVRWFSLETH